MKTLPKFVPVIHVTSSKQAIEQADIAFDNGAGGIFLIDHYQDHKNLLKVYSEVRDAFLYNWIGVNYLDLTPYSAMALCDHSTVDGLWMDHIRGVEQKAINPNRNHLLFAGTNFKYQGQTKIVDLPETNRVANMFDVTTTSGPATGHAPDIEKLELMKLAIGSRPLALASGVTLENVEGFMPHVDCFMVATGISKSGDCFDIAKLKAMANILNK